MRLITPDSPLYHRRLVREIKARLGVSGPGAYAEVDGVEKRVRSVRYSNGRISITVLTADGHLDTRDATHGRFHDGNGLPITACMVAR